MKRIFSAAIMWLIVCSSIQAEEFASLRILALSPAEGRVVLGEQPEVMRVLRQGDPLVDGRYRIAQVLHDRLVLVAASADQTGEMAWVFKAESPDGAPRVQRFSSKAPEPPQQLDVLNTPLR